MDHCLCGHFESCMYCDGTIQDEKRGMIQKRDVKTLIKKWKDELREMQMRAGRSFYPEIDLLEDKIFELQRLIDDRKD